MTISVCTILSSVLQVNAPTDKLLGFASTGRELREPSSLLFPLESSLTTAISRKGRRLSHEPHHRLRRREQPSILRCRESLLLAVHLCQLVLTSDFLPQIGQSPANDPFPLPTVYEGCFVNATRQIGCEGADDVAVCLRSASVGAIVSAVSTYSVSSEYYLPSLPDEPELRCSSSDNRGTCKFLPIVDGDLIPTLPSTALRNGALAKVAYIGGHTTDDGSIFVGNASLVETDEQVIKAITSRYKYLVSLPPLPPLDRLLRNPLPPLRPLCSRTRRSRGCWISTLWRTSLPKVNAPRSPSPTPSSPARTTCSLGNFRRAGSMRFTTTGPFTPQDSSLLL